MAMNKYMHPRNIYKTPPDFATLAKEHAEFSKIVKTDITGKINIDFKDPQTLRILTKCLLKSDFNLDVEIPQDKLVPTLPLRLNYILWVEDLLTSIQRISDIVGLDIGTGACAIYPLLAARKNQWRMIGTETDADSLARAQQNVQNNKLQSLIELKRSSNSTLISHLFMDESLQKYDFCMCNPPFYSSLQELYESRSPARPPPKNGFTGSPHELITEGGELEFCRKLLKESKEFKENIKIFTTMVGHKYNLAELIQDLKAEGVVHTHTEFCQGRVTRWGLAWTYNNYNIHKLVPPRDKLRKKNVPLTYQLPKLANCANNLESVFNKIKTMFVDLNIIYKIIEKRGNNLCLDVMAKTNTWSNQRKRKRIMKRMDAENAKKIKNDTSNGAEIKESEKSQVIKTDLKQADANYGPVSSNSSLSNETNEKYNITDTEAEPVIHAILKIIKNENDILLQMEFIDGTAGKEGLHQIIQYIKNNWK